MNKYLKSYIVFLFLSLSLNLQAQESLSYPQADMKTYNQYLKGNWKELITTGKEYLKTGEDFYYLQVRMGIAYYELKKYRKAIPYLQKAYKVNRKNNLVNEYLYYAYLFSGRTMDAQKLSERFSVSLKEKLGLDYEPAIDAITFDMRSENFDDYFVGTSGGLLKQDVRTGYSYWGLGFEHRKNSRKIYWNFSRINKPTDIYDIDDNNQQISDDREVGQNQFYFSYYNQIKYGLNFSFAFNYLNIVSKGSTIVPVGGWGRPGQMEITDRYATNEIVGFFALRKDFSNFNIGIRASVSNLDKNFQFQPGFDFTYYPFANTNLYFTVNTDYKIDNTLGNEFVFCPAMGFRLAALYIEPSYTFGELINFTEKDALIINNDDDFISERFEFLTYTYLFKGRLNIFFKYQQYTKTNTYELNNTSNEIKYQNKTFTGGIKWNF
ncbi:MAG: tetratricopeptide repeat protein [Bacteroidales bacterium]|nr:tetratricopeptide repeat protein [Bacteroidales bacterium]